MKNLPASAGDIGDPSLVRGSGGALEEGRKPAPVLAPGEYHGQRSLAGCSPQAAKRQTGLRHLLYT